MKLFHTIVFMLIALLSSANVFAAPATSDDASISAKLTEQVTALTAEQKKELLASLDDKNMSVGKGVATFGVELGKGLGSAAKEIGLAANEFANSRVGMVATFVIVWHFFGRSVMWFIFICIILTMFTRNLRRFLGEYDEKGKFLRYSTKNVSTDMGFTLGLISFVVLGGCFLGAAVNF